MSDLEVSAAERSRAARWSEHAPAFLDFVAAHPEAQQRAQFALLDEPRALRGWPLQSWPVLVGPTMLAELEQASVVMLRLVTSLPGRLFQHDPKRIAEFYGLESEWLALLMLEEPNGIATALARSDFIDTGDALKCLEVNCGSNIGGWQLTVHAERYRQVPLLERFFRERGLEFRCRDSVRAILAHVLDCTCASGDVAGSEVNLAMTLSRAGVYGIRQHPLEVYQATYQDLLRARGLRGALLPGLITDVQERGGVVFVGDRQAHAVLEQHEAATPDFVFRCAKARRVVLFTGPASLILSDKRNLALLSELGEGEAFSPDERAWIARYVPWTRCVRPGEVSWQGRTWEMGELLRAERQQLVLKHATMSAGNGVYLGCRTEEHQWQGLVQYVLARPGWLVQEYLPPAPCWYQRGAQGAVLHDVIWGLLAGGVNYAGCLVRMQPTALQAVINLSQGATSGLLFETD